MDIYVVQPGDTIYSIADRYKVNAATLVRENELPYPDHLVPGETIVITYPTQTYTVQNVDTIEEIAAANNISVNELLRNNPFLSDMRFIYPEEILTIRYERNGTVMTHGYANTFIDRKTLEKTLPYLTYLTVLNYRTTKNGEIIAYEDDSEILRLAKEYGVIPLLLMTTLTVQGEVDLEVTYEVLINEQSQNQLFENVLRIVKEKGYYGVNISAQYINESNQSLFYNYTLNLSNRLLAEGYLTFITINPRIENTNGDVFFEQIDYSGIGDIVNSTLFLQYKWGFNFGPPSPVSSVSNLSVFVDYILPQIPIDKIYIGIPTLGYDWELPYTVGFSRASALTLESVMDLARSHNVTIEFDEASQTPYFKYNTVDMIPHDVRFVNSTTINSLVQMLLEKGVTGTGIWNIMNYFSQMWLVINSQFTIIKLLPEN